ncbi:MAG: L-histidine N(alpha)-methyltransferase, partial [Deltaproteobacteria bacterium]|nr:L-histidine N(alpha)-methyltransferase [Deltaproteobacteria bacterium]
EYYPTRTEIGLLERHADALLAAIAPVEIAELGSGSGRKTELLVDAGRRQGSLQRVALLDVAADFLHASAARMAARWPELELVPVVGDFTRDIARLGQAPGRRLVVFLAGTLGNLDESAVATFFRDVAALLRHGDALLLGVDLVKDQGRLLAAYDDAAGITARFNRNILHVVNDRFGASFELDAFRHSARWNADASRIEMWLEATRPTEVRVDAADVALRFDAGEGLRTELSCKYTRRSLQRRLAPAGLQLRRWMIDDEGLFALGLIEKAPAPLARLQQSWALSDDIFGLLTPQAWELRGIPLRHPPIFYLGHLPAFAWNQLGAGVLGLPPHDASFDRLFERGIDPPEDAVPTAPAAGPDAAQWPDVDAVLAYRDAIRAAVVRAAARLASEPDHGDPLRQGGRVLHLCAEHELMHHETLLYLLHALPPALLRRPETGPLAAAPSLGRHDGSAPERVVVPAGRTQIGSRWQDVAFAWDAELPAQQVHVDAFALDAQPVTIARYAAWLAREQAEGRSIALPEGWRADPAMPSGVAVRWLFGWLDRDAAGAWPVRLACAEAEAFAAAHGARLPTEAELHRACEVAAPARAVRDDAVDLATVAPRPLRAPLRGRIDELVGNGWEWTSTAFAPLPGFTAWARTYPGYAADFFDGEHRVVFGGSWATHRSLLRPGFRNWYRQRYPWVFSKFRLAWDVGAQ